MDIDPPQGKIVFNCQIFKTPERDQICVVNADGGGFRRLTHNDDRRHSDPSFAPNGAGIVYVAYREANYYDLFELDFSSGSLTSRTPKRVGKLASPEISPDGKRIVYGMWNPRLSIDALYVMERGSDESERFLKFAGWDPTWAPDGKSILFASNVDGATQLYVAALTGKVQRVSSLPAVRGRSDWSPDGQFIVTDSGAPWNHEVYIMNADGSGARILSPPGGNAQEASFSPDGKWVVFSAYYDHPGDENGCEIYVLRVDGTDLRRLTDNDYCDYLPRWGK